MFAETSWSVKSLIGQISYLVSDCAIQAGKVLINSLLILAEILHPRFRYSYLITFQNFKDSHIVPLVKDNCYSELLGAKMLNQHENHLQPQTSRLSYTVFTINQEENLTTSLRCQLHLCLQNNCKENKVCPVDPVMKYSLLGSH